MKLTRGEIKALLETGDLILVHYYRTDFVSAGIKWFSGGTASHALCSLDQLDQVEADVIGICRTSLFNYLRGQCRLTVKRIKPKLNAEEQDKVARYWLKRVGESYDFGMIVGMVPLFLIRRIVARVSPKAGRWCMRHLVNLLASRSKTTCAELWVHGVRQVRPDFMKGFPADNISPEALMRDTHLQTVAVWDKRKLDR